MSPNSAEGTVGPDVERREEAVLGASEKAARADGVAHNMPFTVVWAHLRESPFSTNQVLREEDSWGHQTRTLARRGPH